MSVQPNRATDVELLTPGAVAAVLFVDPKTVTRWARAGKIDSIRTPGGHRRYRRSDVYALRAGEGLRRDHPAAPESDRLVPVRAPGPAQDGGRRQRALHTAVAAKHPPWAAAELAESVATALEHEAEAAIETVWQAQAELEAARDAADEATSRAAEARARAQAEADLAPAPPSAGAAAPRMPTQRRAAASPALQD